jgi:16S rRNA C967 or C1407 C5-methylase (RsmB/RsmF family)
VVQWLLDGEKDAFLIPLEFHKSAEKIDDALKQPDFIREGSIKGTIRFVPSSGDASFSGGGFFVAKIGKKQPT